MCNYNHFTLEEKIHFRRKLHIAPLSAKLGRKVQEKATPKSFSHAHN